MEEQQSTTEVAAEGGVIRSPRWPDGCPLTLDELVNPKGGHRHG